MNLQIDFQKLATNAAQAMRPLTQALTRAGLDILEVAGGAKSSREAGVVYREVTVTFTDSQKLALRIKDSGDAYKVFVNGKVTPIYAQDDLKAAAAELAKILDTRRAAHQKRMAAVLMKPPEGAKTAAPKMKQVLQEQIQQVDQAIAGATEELAALRAQ